MRTIGFFLILTFMLTLFRTMPKVMFGLIAFLIVAASGLYIYFDIEYKEKEKQLALVTIDVSYNTEKCPHKYPLRVTIFNNSNNTVDKITYRIEARRPRFSNNLVNGYTSFVSTRIIRAGNSYGVCYGLPILISKNALPNTLIWSTGDNTRIWFEKTE